MNKTRRYAVVTFIVFTRNLDRNENMPATLQQHR